MLNLPTFPRLPLAGSPESESRHVRDIVAYYFDMATAGIVLARRAPNATLRRFYAAKAAEYRTDAKRVRAGLPIVRGVAV